MVVKDWPLLNGDWYGKTIFMPSYTPTGNPVILEVDETGKAKVVFEGERSTDFEFMIQSPDGRPAIWERIFLAITMPGWSRTFELAVS